jgi:hypothetical protein
VEAQQCVKLTRTNRPFGLTIKLSQTADPGVLGKQSFLHGSAQARFAAVQPIQLFKVRSWSLGFSF